MNEDRMLEFMALMSDYMRDTDRRFEQLITVMHDGFGRLSSQLTDLTTEVRGTNQRVDHLTERVDHLTEEVTELKTDMREVKTQVGDINRRLGNTFDQTGRLTEVADNNSLRLTHVEGALQPTNAELDQRLRALENIVLPKAS
ncbi:hypothetical protein Q5H93_17035 [Hymenobacter sp. ASUV-10]|uniref:t-SNARE coiled-coil homology domain-containing protein n=1 Tax=Hymenobacter aranciens TaxID=3063996 RepID=A0ABT9BE12_9BACT|nr:hypothetical protein [Hymenobacter sp. ASUV-10]MDO7876452.1 hypothetical protein [Hymenobacter sp. ASUV-10]